MCSLQPETYEPRPRASDDSRNDDETLLPTGQMRRRYQGVSRMWLDRRLAIDPTFPKPVYIGGRRYWLVSELRQWESALSRQKPRDKAAPAAGGGRVSRETSEMPETRCRIG
jgi:predicted DNA-binding transcriptional regulator AlpA